MEHRKMIDQLCITLINFYRQYLSPRKGFSCAHRVLHGGEPCSIAVREIIKNNGLIAGRLSIKLRFQECSIAARILSPKHSADLDCGICSDIGGCLDSSGPAGCFDSSGNATNSVKPSSDCSTLDFIFLFLGLGNPVKLIILTSFLSLAGGSGYLLYGSKIDEVGIRLKDSAIEDRDRKLSFVKNSELPDYQLILKVSGDSILSNIRHNTSAKEWIYLQIDEPFDKKTLQQITIVNKQLLTSKKIEVVDFPIVTTETNRFEYKFQRRWSF